VLDFFSPHPESLEHTMSRSMIRRSQGTNEQARAQQIRALANQIIRLKRDTNMNAEQRMQTIKFFATR
jgi:ribosomal protein L17